MATRRKPNWFKKTERLLYDYKTFDTAIRNLEAELETIMPQATRSVIMVGQGSTGSFFESQTEEWAIKRVESPRAKRLLRLLQEKRRWRKSIKEIRAKLSEEENTFLWLRYDLEKPHDEVRETLAEQGFPMSRGTYFKLRREVIERVAKHMGLI